MSNRNYTQNTLILISEPFVGFMPEDVHSWLNEHNTDKDLAFALAEVYNHTTVLGHELDESDDCWIRYAYDKWQETEERLNAEVIERMNASDKYETDSCAKGNYYKIKPFMESNGFRACCGWWVKEERETQ